MNLLKIENERIVLSISLLRNIGIPQQRINAWEVTLFVLFI